MKNPDLTAEWEKMAPQCIEHMRETPNSTREIQLDPVVIKECGDVDGLRVIDLGCGEGRFSRKLSGLGAESVLGLDLSNSMIAAAQDFSEEGQIYKVVDVQNLEFLKDESFDLAISYLNQCDLPDFYANNREVHRILREDGKFLVVNLHPMRSATGLWCKDDMGKKKHVTVINTGFRQRKELSQ